jgi:ElaA protein
VEQNCPYQDCDGKDLKAHHFSAWDDGVLVAYTRLIPKGVSYDKGASIGRVLTSPKVRGQKLGKELMQKSIDKLYELYGQMPIIIGAQLYLKRFYESFAFEQQGEGYLEDNIPHIVMEKK